MRYSVVFFAAVAWAEPETERPVSKVVKLLTDMQTQLQKEADQDAEIYNKLQCWCSSNSKAKETTIKSGSAKSQALVAKIDELTAKSAELYAQAEKQKVENEKNRQSLLSAGELRAKELAEFNKDHKDLLQAIKGLDAAITVLSKHNSPPKESLVNIASIVRHTLHTHEKMLGDLAATAKQVIGSYLQQPAGFQSYANQSGQIFGILGQMKDTFEANMGVALKEEQAKAEAFAQLETAKKAEIRAGKQTVEEKELDKANTDKENAEAQQDLEDTDAALAADRQFLADITAKCKTDDEEWARRSKTRADEIAAVSEAIKIINNDEAFTNFGKTVNTPAADFLQLNSRRRSLREGVASLLQAASKKTSDPKLAALAVSAQLDSFTKVKAAIDKMVAELQKQQKDEVAHRDWCIEEHAQNNKETAVSTENRSSLEAQIADLEATIARLTKEIKVHQDEITETKDQMRRAGDDRGAANAEFQETIADQRTTQAVLNRAHQRLKVFYNPDVKIKGYNAFVEQPVAGADPTDAPKNFKTYEKNAGGNRVLAMLQSIIDESKALEHEAQRDENDQQAAYEAFVKDSNDKVAMLLKAIADKTAAKGSADSDKVQATKDLKSTMTDLENLANYKGELHKSCDFVQDNFETRQAARSQEMEALRQAKAILSGAQ